MARMLNFDAVVVETIDVTKRGRTFALREDVPMTTLVRTFAVLEKQQELNGRDDLTAAMTEAWITELEAMTLALCGDIFRHTLPETSDAEIAELFAFEEQLQLVMLFFTVRSQALRKQAPTLAASSPTSMEPATQPAAASAEASATGASVSATASRRRPGRQAGTTRPKR